MDAGSAIVASVFATLVFVLVIAGLRRLGRTDLDVILGLGQRIAREPAAAFLAGVIAVIGIGMLEGLALAAIWGTIWLTFGPPALPIAPLQGALLAAVQWPLARIAVRQTRGGSAALLMAMLGYGGTLGLVYAPGI